MLCVCKLRTRPRQIRARSHRILSNARPPSLAVSVRRHAWSRQWRCPDVLLRSLVWLAAEPVSSRDLNKGCWNPIQGAGLPPRVADLRFCVAQMQRRCRVSLTRSRTSSTPPTCSTTQPRSRRSAAGASLSSRMAALPCWPRSASSSASRWRTSRCSRMWLVRTCA